MKLLTLSAADLITAFIFAAISFILTYYFYRKTNLPAGKLRILRSLRFFSLFLILFLLLNPFIRKISERIQKPFNIVLIDNSLSITLNRKSEIESKELLEKVRKSLSTDTETKYFLFGNGITGETDGNTVTVSDTGNSGNYSTNLSETFRDLRDMTGGSLLNSIIILTDGIINDGGGSLNEAGLLNAPVNFILTGDTADKKDVSVRELHFNRTVTSGKKTKIRASVKSYGYNKNIRITLKENGRQIQSSSLELKTDILNYSAEFTVSYPSEGIINYEIETESLEGEQTYLNNKEDCYIKYISGGRKYLLLSGAPGADFAFFSRMLKRTEGAGTDIYTLKNSDTFYEGNPDFKPEYDLLILFGYPSEKSGSNETEKIKNLIKFSEIPLIFFDASNTDYGKLKQMEEILPFNFSNISKNEKETSAKTTVSEGLNREEEILTFDISRFKIYKSMNGISAKPGAVTVLSSSSDSEPILLISNTKGRKSAAFLGYGIFKWALGKDVNEAEGRLRALFSFMEGSILDADRQLPFTLETDRQKYLQDSEVNVKAYLKNPAEPVDAVEFTVSGADTSFTENLKNSGSGIYEGRFNAGKNGEFTIFANAYYGGSIKYSDSVRISTGKDYREFKDLTPDKTLISGISQMTGGQDLSGRSEKETAEVLQKQRKKENIYSEESDNIHFRNYAPYLIILIVLLGTEWYLRKRYNLS